MSSLRGAVRRIPLLLPMLVLLSVGAMFAAEEVSTFPAYIDSDLCSHLMLGPINPARMECSQKTYKDGSNAVVVRLRDNLEEVVPELEE